MKKSNNDTGIVIAVIAIAVVVVMGLFLMGRGGMLTVSQQTDQKTQTIQNTSDLNSASTDLDSTDLNGMDKELNQLDADATF